MAHTPPAPCDRCGETPATLIFARGRLLCFPCHATLFPTPAPEPRRQGPIDRCHCGICSAPVLPGFEVKS